MTRTPKFSVVIPLYNKSAFVVEAIASVQAQIYPVTEIIVIDDGSTDGGAERVEAIADPRISLYRQANAGVSVARNRGIEAACGDLVCFLDADDRYLPGFLQAIVDLADSFPGAGMYATGYFRFWADGRRRVIPVSPALRGRDKLVKDFYAVWCKSPFLYTVSLAIRREVFTDGEMRFPPGERLGEDQDLWFRIAERYAIAYAESPLVEYRMDVYGSATQTGKVLDVLPCYRRLEERLAAGVVPHAMRRSARKLLASHLLDVARFRLGEGDVRGGWNLAADNRTGGNPLYRLRTIGALCCAAFGFGRAR
ncbi:glycosyltransferase family 2 protein [Nitrosovibrio tenuis]|uniref:Glycosyltransferase involved in cell wall bisynthesis n=1 Tax=Nitrosovibrio tenuis TaxID=1233 RepID=A0A1H7FK60_9PROT|nr:glycosyltransferase family A protein [Nitrosovibrio tenuis]SEK26493.1 Glycosyltransferase involved in cell wall bisynthesis [Nitrosovibrio tenuis]